MSTEWHATTKPRNLSTAMFAIPSPTPSSSLHPALQRILHVDYHIPPHVKASEECKDLLSRILVADPHKRITVDGIYNHKWYLKGLPPGVREMNDRVQPPPDGLQVGTGAGAARGGASAERGSFPRRLSVDWPQEGSEGLWEVGGQAPAVLLAVSPGG